MARFITLLIPWLLASAPTAHPYYVSVTEVEYSSKTGEIGISCKFFTDDLEEGLKKRFNGKIDLLKGDKSKHQAYVETYLKEHFQIQAGQQKPSLRFLGMEQGPEATWCYFEAAGITAFQKIDITSDCLYEIKKEQIHIFHVTVDGERKSKRLVNPERSCSLTF